MSKRNDDDEKFKEKMKAWMLIQVTGQTSVSFLNKKKLEKDIRSYLETIKEGGDLKEFADYFIDSCLGSKAYKTAVFGAIPMSDAGAATKLLEDIEEVTMRIPEIFGLKEESSPVREAFHEIFLMKIEGGEKLLAEKLKG